jgi:disulfide oxidoreductase YuzD
MQITSIKIKDFLIIKEAEIKPHSKLNIFVGKNKHGKTSIIKAIIFALTGIGGEDCIRNGADKAEVALDLSVLSDKLKGYKVKRAKTKKSETLKVITPDGDIKAAPQKFLYGLLSQFSFDPIQFVLLEGKERAKYLREMFKTKLTMEQFQSYLSAGIHVDQAFFDHDKDGIEICNNLERHFYEQRSVINKEISTQTTIANSLKLGIEGFDPAAFEGDRQEEFRQKEIVLEKSISDIEAQMRSVDRAQAILKKLGEKKAVLEEKIKGLQMPVPTDELNIVLTGFKWPEEGEGIGYVNECLPHLRLLADELNAGISATLIIIKACEEYKAKADSLQAEWIAVNEAIADSTPPPIPTGIESVKTELLMVKKEKEENLHAIEAFKKHQQYTAKIAEIEVIKNKASVLSSIIEKLRKDIPQALSAEAKVPIDDLRFAGDAVYIGEKNMDNLSTSEQVGIALQIVRKMNEKSELKIICLDWAESLDDDTLKEFERQIQSDEFQYFLSEVLHEGQIIPEGAFRVVDGEIS